MNSINNTESARNIGYDNSESGLTATDVQGAVDELAESYPADKVMMSNGTTTVEEAVDGVRSRITEVTGTITALNSNLTYDYPSGFTFQNARIICFEVYMGGIWRNASMMFASPTLVANASTRVDYITVFATGETTLDAPFRLVLLKVWHN